MPELVFCGAIFRDLSTYVDGFPQRGETKFGAKYQTGFGGKTSNAAVMAAKLQDKNATGEAYKISHHSSIMSLLSNCTVK